MSEIHTVSNQIITHCLVCIFALIYLTNELVGLSTHGLTAWVVLFLSWLAYSLYHGTTIYRGWQSEHLIENIEDSLGGSE